MIVSARWFKGVAAVAAVGALLYVGTIVYAPRSEPYKYSERWARESPDVRARIGRVTATHFYREGGFSEQFLGEGRVARVATRVDGERGSLIANLQLKNVDGEWQVVACRLEPIQASAESL